MVSFLVGSKWSLLTRSCCMKDRCAPSSNRMFASALNFGLLTVAIAVFNKQVEPQPKLVLVELMEVGVIL